LATNSKNNSALLITLHLTSTLLLYRYNHYNEGDEHGTSHFSIVDKDRNAVAMTCTVNYPFGAKFISEQTGILMNNEMDDFSTPMDNITNGLPAKPNFIKPNKRPLSTMSPTIVLKVRVSFLRSQKPDVTKLTI
jgi:gamma-glutamyltranspeptidase